MATIRQIQDNDKPEMIEVVHVDQITGYVVGNDYQHRITFGVFSSTSLYRCTSIIFENDVWVHRFVRA